MNIHIIANEKFLSKFVWMIDTMYGQKTNIIYIYDNKGKACNLNSKNVVYIEKFNEIDFGKLSLKDKLFVHGFYDSSLVRFLFFNRKYFTKDQLVLIIWGADLYNARAVLKTSGIHLNVRINEIIKKGLIKHCNKFMTFAYPDFDLICKWYGAKGKQFDCIYPTNADIGLLNTLIKKKEKSNTIRILLGNSATVSNQHIPALKLLHKFVDKDIIILCPLSYGDKEYAKKVREFGEKEFGVKFVSVDEYMSPEEYSKLLNSVDIAVFFNNRQQATGNIEILGYLRKKIYLRSDTTTWKHYVERDGCHFSDALQIKKISFKEFVSINKEELEYNHDYIRKVWDISEIKLLWDIVINS